MIAMYQDNVMMASLACSQVTDQAESHEIRRPQ